MLQATPEGLPRLAVLTLPGTGMRAGGASRRIRRIACNPSSMFIFGMAGWGGRIRTFGHGSKVRCLTTWPRPMERCWAGTALYMSTAAASECGLPLCELDRLALNTVQLVSAEVLVADSVSEL